LFNKIKSKSKMKKLVFAIAALVTVSFVSCGNETKPATEEVVDSAVVEEVVDTLAEADTAVVADSVVADTTVAE
jgi:hypothetical protein